MRSIERSLWQTFAVGAILVADMLQVAVAQPPAERGTVSGVVLDADTEAPVPQATVRLTPLQVEEGGPPAQEEVQAATAAEGRFTFEVEEGLYRLHVEAKGYEAKPDETIEVQARKPLELRLVLQSVVGTLRKEVEALRAAWQEQHTEEAEPTPEQQEVLAVLTELERAVQAGDVERALHLFSEDHFQRVDLGREADREPRDPVLVISANRYAVWRDALRQAVAAGLQVQFVNPAVTLRGERAGVEAILVATQGRAILAQGKQVTLVREKGAWRIAGITFPLPDPLAASQEPEAQKLVREAEYQADNPEEALLRLEQISYQFADTWCARWALEGALNLARYRLHDAEREVEICRDLLRRFPRPPGLSFYSPGTEGSGWYGVYANYWAQQSLADALYRLGRFEEAAQEYEKCFPYLPPPAQELIAPVRERLDFIRQHDGPAREPLRLFAQERFQELLEQFPASDLVDNALLRLAWQKEGKEKRRLYQRILDEYPDSDMADAALCGLADTYREEVRWEGDRLITDSANDALKRYREVVERFPGRDWAQAAQGRIKEIETLLAEAGPQRKAAEEALRASADAALAALRSEQAELRKLAAEELGKRRVREAEAALIPLLQDANAGVREAAAWALGKVGTEQAVAPLRALAFPPPGEEREGDEPSLGRNPWAEEQARTAAQRALLEIEYTGDVVERPYDHPMVPGRRLAVGKNEWPFVYEHQGICTNLIMWVPYAGAGQGHTLTDRHSARYPAWSPDGKEVVYVATTWPQHNENPRHDLWVVNADDVSQRPLTTTGDVVGHPQWSPGKPILFTRQSPEATTIWLKNFEAEKQMTFEGHALHPTYSPDGQCIAYLFSPHAAKNFSLWVTDVGDFPPIIADLPIIEDLHRQKLAEEVLPTPIAWSRDGQRIAFTDAEGRLATVEVATGAAQSLTNPPPFVRDVSPAWSPDNRLIAFVRETRTARTLWIVRADRPGEQPLTVGARFDEDPQFDEKETDYYWLYYATSPNGKEGDEGDWRLHAVTFARCP